jgi:hypothetical protein
MYAKIKNVIEGTVQSNGTIERSHPKGGPFDLENRFVVTLGSHIETIMLQL